MSRALRHLVTLSISGTLALTVLTGCGDSGPTKEEAAAQAAAAAEAQKKETCDKLGRTWAVKAESLGPSLTLAAAANVEEAMDAMKAASDEVKIEQCSEELLKLLTFGNYQAAVANATLITCQKWEMGCAAAGDRWKKDGEPIVAAVFKLVG